MKELFEAEPERFGKTDENVSKLTGTLNDFVEDSQIYLLNENKNNDEFYIDFENKQADGFSESFSLIDSKPPENSSTNFNVSDVKLKELEDLIFKCYRSDEIEKKNEKPLVNNYDNDCKNWTELPPSVYILSFESIENLNKPSVASTIENEKEVKETKASLTICPINFINLSLKEDISIYFKEALELQKENEIKKKAYLDSSLEITYEECLPLSRKISSIENKSVEIKSKEADEKDEKEKETQALKGAGFVI